MPATPRKVLILVLFLTSATGVALAWRAHQALNVQADALNAEAAKQRADFEARLKAAEQRAKDLEAQLAAAQERARNELPFDAPDGAEPPPDGGEPMGPPPRQMGRRAMDGLVALMDNPEFARLLAVQQSGQLDANYAALFKKLNLSPAQLSRFKELLTEKQSTFRDVLAAARAQGLDPRQDRTQIGLLVAQANAEIDQNIQSVLGASGYADYKQYEQTAPQRNLVGQLETRLSYTPTPLSPQQADQLLQVLADTTKTSNPARAAARGQPGGGRVTLTDASISQASAVLTPDQTAALQQMQQEQQARQKMMQLLRQQRPPPASGTAPAPRPPSG